MNHRTTELPLCGALFALLLAGPALAAAGASPDLAGLSNPAPVSASQAAPDPDGHPLKLQVRGGFSRSAADFPFAASYPTGSPAFHQDYGVGLFGAVDLLANLSNDLGIELGSDVSALTGDDSAGSSLDSDCNTGGTETILGLIADCHDRVDSQVDTQIVTAKLLAKYHLPFGDLAPSVGAGPTLLYLSSSIDADHLFPGGFESFVDRDTSFLGGGVKGGLEESVPIPGYSAMSVNAELYGSWVRGERELKIRDYRTQNGSFLALQTAHMEDHINVAIVDAALSVSHELPWCGDGASVEIGGTYRHLWSPMLTSNLTGNGVNVGEHEKELGYWTVFFGFNVPIDL